MKGITSLLLLVALATPMWGVDIQRFAKLDSALVDVVELNRLQQRYRLDSAVLSRFEASIQYFENDDRRRQPLPSPSIWII